MIVGGYTLDLYCDKESNQHEYDEFPDTYADEFGSTCRRRARESGWILKRNGTAICPKCSGRGKKSTVKIEVKK